MSLTAPITASQRLGVVVVAAGRGSRFGGDIPKQYAPLPYPDGRPILRATLETLRAALPGADIVCVIHDDDEDHFITASAGLREIRATPGGATRAQSVAKGLAALSDNSPQVALVHDGARPFVSVPLIERLLAALDDPATAAAIPALAVTDSVKRGTPNASAVLKSVPRDGLWRVQTPQVFRYDTIVRAHQALTDVQRTQATDDAWVLEHTDPDAVIALVAGETRNIKVTLPEDLTMPLPVQPDIRTGSGYDAHRFGSADDLPLMLSGVEVAHDVGLAGHSDADVALHAITDAILGACAAGDIGQHFPPSDPDWRGVSSDRFVAHALSLMGDRGGSLLNLDLTLICEAPKIGPVRADMRDRLASITGLDPARINIKATTTEGMGFTGRREGIAAQAAVSVRFDGS